jgi:hypothetical protein
MASFQRIVNRETVLTFGVKPCDWDDEDQAQLHEAMILAWKENPDWTDEQATEACKKQVDRIRFANFKSTYKYVVEKAPDDWHSMEEAYADYLEHGKKGFEKLLNEAVEFADFCRQFYETLREMWNIDYEGMQDAFLDMKQKGWTHADYKRHLNEQKKAMRAARR